MRSDVVKVKRDADGIFMGEEEERSVYDMLSDLLPEIKDNETKSVRISVEIVGEKGEEKVGSHTACLVNNGGKAFLWIGAYGHWFPSLDHIVKDWQNGEARLLKSICCDTPSGVPEVTFIETPRERLKRFAEDASTKGNAIDAFGCLMSGVQDYLAATEEAEKKGGG